MFCLAIYQQHAGLACENIPVVAPNTAILGDTRVLRAPNTAYWAKPRCTDFVFEKYGYVNADAFGPHPLRRVKYLHFWAVRHLCSTWTSSASALWPPPFICRYLIFLAFGTFFAMRLIIFNRGWPNPRWAKSCWAKDYYILIAGNHTSLRIGLEDGLLCEKKNFESAGSKKFWICRFH